MDIKITCRRGIRIIDGKEIRDITPINFTIHKADRKPAKKRLTMDDVWGKEDNKTHVRSGSKIIVANQHEKCPIWNDIVDYKSVTMVCDLTDESEVAYWLEYVLGPDCISRRKQINDKQVALRGDYMCW